MFDKLQHALKEYLLAGDKESVDTLRLLKSAILAEAKTLGQDSPTEEVCIKVLREQLKMRQDALKIYREAGVSSNEHQEETELRLLESFLPKQLTDQELEAVVTDQLESSGLEADMRNMGALINLIVDQVGQSSSRSDIAKVLQQKINK